MRFADISRLKAHSRAGEYLNNNRLNPKRMSVESLKEEFRKRNLSTTGKKEILVKRLEDMLST